MAYVDKRGLQRFWNGFKGKLAEIDNKANKNGYYSTLGAGVADNLIGKGSVSATYTRRTAGGTADIGSGAAAIKSIHGNTIVWNQLVQQSSKANKTENGITFTNNNDGTWTVNGTATADVFYTVLSRDVNYTVNHKYYIGGCPSGGSTSTYYSYYVGGLTQYDTGSGLIKTSFSSGTSDHVLMIKNGTVCNNIVFKPQLIDLTQMFGAGNEPTSVAQFKAMFPLDYYAYNTGELLSFNGTGIKTDGFNQLDGDGHIKVIAGQTYSIEGTYTSLVDSDGTAITVSNSEFTASKNDTYTMVGGSCVHLKHSGIRNGETEDYWNSTLALPIATHFPTGMKSAGSAYDELLPNKKIVRIGAVDLGSLNWGKTTHALYGDYFYASVTSLGIKYLGAVYSYQYPLLNIKYSSTRRLQSEFIDKTICPDSSGNTIVQLQIKDSNYTEATAFKTAMNGVMLYYELATPTETDITPALSLTYRVDDFGTEELLPVNDDEPTTSPIIYDVQYAMNAVDTLRNLDKNYQNQDSMDALLTAMGTVLNFTYTKTWDSTNRKYTYTITSTGGGE